MAEQPPSARSGSERAVVRRSESAHAGPDAPAAVARGTELADRFAEHLRERRLIESGHSVVVAVSGGLDSVVLLHLLLSLRGSWALSLIVAHFDHRMRPGSAADAQWVRGLCRAWDVPFDMERSPRPLRSEADARRARYAFLERVADARDAVRIATAHHGDDQTETVLFRIIRGTGLRGLAGIPERRGHIVRPLLPFRRRELAAYARAAGLRYRRDPTNLSSSYARNRLRHEVLPRLESIAPGAAAAIGRLATHARAAEAAWDEVLDDAIADVIVARDEDGILLARPRLLAYHSYIRARMLRRLLRQRGSRPDRAGTRAILTFIKTGASGGRVDVAGGVVIEREFDRIRIRRREARRNAEPDRALRIARPQDGSGDAIIGGRPYVARWTTAAEGAGGEATAFDAAALRFPLELRGWRPGDRIRLSYGTKKLKKLFAERRIPRSERRRRPVLADAEGRVLWVLGVARAAFAEPVSGHRVLRIGVRDARYD